MVALPKTVVHCAGRSLYHRIKTWFWRCLRSMPRDFPYHGKTLCLSTATCICRFQKIPQVMRTAPSRIVHESPHTRSRSSDQAPGTQPKASKSASFAARCEPRFPTRCFFSFPIPSYANNLDPIHGSLPVGCALLMHAIATQARERAVPAAQLATTLSRSRLSITPTQILLLLMKADPTNSDR